MSDIESLESRRLFAAAPIGLEMQVTAYSDGASIGSSVAMDSAGNSIVVWENQNQLDGNADGIFAQRYDANGTAQGSEFRVNSYTTGNQNIPKVAMDSAGAFVVTWIDDGQDGSGYGVYAQRYNSAGVAQGGEFRVNTYTTGVQGSPHVAIDSAGDFVIAWNGSGVGDVAGIYAQRYSNTGTLVGANFRVNAYTTGGQEFPAIAMDAGGNFVVTWTSYAQDGSNYGVYAQRYNAAGAVVQAEFRVNTATTNEQSFSSVGMDAAGDFTIAWDSDATTQDGNGFGIVAQRFNASGARVGSEFIVNTYTTNSQLLPQVAVSSAGDFAVVWESLSQDGDNFGVFGKRFTAAGAADGAEFRVNTYTTSAEYIPALGMNASGQFLAAWQSQQQGSSDFGIDMQRYQPTTVGPIITEVLDGPRLVNANDRLPVPVSSLTVDFSENMSVVGGATGANSVLNPANWQLLRNNVSLHDPIDLITFAYNSTTNRFEATVVFSLPLDDGLYQLIAGPSIHSAAGQPLDGDADGVVGGSFQRSFFVAQAVNAATETRVNTYTTSVQTGAAVATDAAGDYAIVWTSKYEDGAGYGIYGQRFNSSGVAQGTEFRVNTYTVGDEVAPAIAMNSAGAFVVTWQSSVQDNGNPGIYAQRYNSSGVAQGSEFRVNSYTTNSQITPKVAIDQSGNFVITWESDDQANATSLGDIYARRFNSAGTALGAEFLVNTYTTNVQEAPAIAMDSAGDFVIAWDSLNQVSLNTFDIFAQRFSASGGRLLGEFQVNTYTTNSQRSASVAMDAVGDFVVTWQSYEQTGAANGYDIYGQRFDRAGVAQSFEFQINDFATGAQANAKVTMDATGEFLVSWGSANQDGSDYGVFSQRFDSAGRPVENNDVQVNTTTQNFQNNPTVAMDAAGDAVIAWTSFQGNNSDVYSQRIKTDVAPLLYAVDVSPLGAASSLTTPIAPTLQAYDEDNTTWTGATVQITSNDASGQDVLGFVNELGITGTFNAATGTLTLTGTASISSYRTALQSVTYHNISSTPNTTLTRTISFTANDGLLTGDAVSRDVNVSATGTAAVVSGVSGTGTYAENAPAIALASGLAIADASTNYLKSATVSFTNWQAEDRVIFNNIFALQHTFVQDLTAHTASLTISGTDTLYDYQVLLRSVVYSDVSDNPNLTQRVAHFTVNDGLSNSNSVVRDINVVSVNDRPIVSGIEPSPLPYQANNPAYPPQSISSTLQLADPDSSNLTKATIQISSGYQNAVNDHDLLSFVNQNGITGSFNATTGTLTLTGTSSGANYRAAIRSVTFSASGTALVAGTRTLSITVSDDFSPTPAISLVATRDVNVVTTNIAPGITGVPSAALAYVRGAPGAAIAPGLFVLDSDGLNLASATVQITGNFQSGKDVLAATTLAGITTSFNATTGVLTLTGVASLAHYQSVLQSVTFKTATTANTLSRTITFVGNDGLAASSPISRSVTLT